MKDFDLLYTVFTDEMVKLIMSDEDLKDRFQDIIKDPFRHVDLVSELFKIWYEDRSRIKPFLEEYFSRSRGA